MEKKYLTQEEFNKLPKDERDAYVSGANAMQAALDKAAKEDAELKTMKMKDFKGLIEGIVRDKISPLTKVDRKYWALPGIKDLDLLNRTDPVAKWQKTTKFLNALVQKDVQALGTMEKDQIASSQQKASYLNESTGAEGAFLVPEEFAAEILRLSDIYGVVRRNARHIPMRFDVMNFPAAGGTDVSTHWVSEAGAIPGTNPDFRQVILVINKLATLPVMTNELLADANVDVIAYLSDLIAEQLAKEEDTQGLIGVGSPFVGVVNATGAPTYPHDSGTGFEALSYSDLVKMTARIKTSAQPNARFYFHRSMIAHIHSLITTAGAPIFPNAPNSIVGWPLEAAEVLPGVTHTAFRTDATTYALFGDLKKALLMGERGTLRMKLLDQGTVGNVKLAEQDAVALRVIERIAFGVALPSAVVIVNS